MSHAATNWAFDLKLPALQSRVLLQLAFRHNGDTGRCDPSLGRLAEDCGMSRNAVKNAIEALVKSGLVQVDIRKEGLWNQTHSYVLSIGTGPMRQATGGRSSEGGGVGHVVTPNKEIQQGKEQVQQPAPPAASLDSLQPEAQTPTEVAEQPPVRASRAKSPKASKAATTAELELPEWVPVEAWNDFATMRTETKHPLKTASRKVSLKKLEKLRDEGHDPRLVLEKATERGWRGLFGDAETIAPKPKRVWVEADPAEFWKDVPGAIVA